MSGSPFNHQISKEYDFNFRDYIEFNRNRFEINLCGEKKQVRDEIFVDTHMYLTYRNSGTLKTRYYSI